MDRPCLYLGICIWSWTGKRSATWHVSGYIPIRCASRREAGNIMVVLVISVACRQVKTKNELFSCVLACKCVLCGFNLQTCFTIYHWRTKLQSIRLELFIPPKTMSSIFSRDKLMIPIVLSQSLWIFSIWLVFTSNLNSQTTLLKVKSLTCELVYLGCKL